MTNKEILLPTLDQRIKLLALIDPCLQQSKRDWVSGITQVSPHLYIMAGSPGSEELNEYLSEKYPDRRKRSLAFIKPLEELRKISIISLSTAHHQQIMWFVHS